MSRTLQLRLAYNGEQFSGWQIQPDQRTVQGVLSDAIQSICGETVVPKGSSRTDAGVHASEQSAHFKTKLIQTMSPIKISLSKTNYA